MNNVQSDPNKGISINEKIMFAIWKHRIFYSSEASWKNEEKGSKVQKFYWKVWDLDSCSSFVTNLPSDLEKGISIE